MRRSKSYCMNGELHRAHPPPPAYGGVTLCGPECPALEGCHLQGSHHSVEVCSATSTRPAYGRGVPGWSDGRGRGGGGSAHSLSGGSCSGLAEGALGPLEPLLPPLPPELEEHLRTCRCTCNHMGYGNYQVGAPPHHSSVSTRPAVRSSLDAMS